MTWENLAAMDDNGMAMYLTPGSDRPYWASQPSFSNDRCVATVHDFSSYGCEYQREDGSFELEDVFEFEIN